MNRRGVIAVFGGAAMGPWAARAQQAPEPVIGILGSASREQWAPRIQAFREGLEETGFIEGKTLTIEYRWADSRNDRLPALAADLVVRGVAGIVVLGNTLSALAARDATQTIPIVFRVAADPVELGLVASLREPGGNLTGVTTLGAEIGSKHLELLRELIPHARVFALLVNPTNTALAAIETLRLPAFAEKLGLKLHVFEASADGEFEAVFARIVAANASGLVIGADTFFNSRNGQMAALALRSMLPTISPYREYVEAGGLMSYGGSIAAASRQAGIYMGRILKGEKPATLPVQQVAKLELALNLKTAAAVGLAIPPALLARADEVIE